ncbi:MAG: hypothetical protein JXA54_06855 [Candidatus Heimdallarchaeota archaeon]|nr:hypothetical protein [Candidatus Heimdallarchaeota archaeon]
MIQFNRKILEVFIISSFLILGSLTVGLGVHFSYSVKQDAWLLLNASGSSPHDQKLIIFVDVPSFGGVPLRYFIYEFTSRGLGDNWYFYNENKNSNPRSVANPDDFDFIIILASDSSGNGNWDDFSLKMTLFSGVERSITFRYGFGDDVSNVKQIGVWQISSDKVLSFANDGISISSLSCSGSIICNNVGYTIDDWKFVFYFLNDYFENGDELAVEQLLISCSFPKPVTIS